MKISIKIFRNLGNLRGEDGEGGCTVEFTIYFRLSQKKLSESNFFTPK